MRFLPRQRCVLQELLQIHILREFTLLLVYLILCAVFPAGAELSPGISSTCQGQDPIAPVGNVRMLAPGEIVRCHIDAGATQSYELTLAARQFAQIVIEQKGVDVAVKVV